MHNTIFCKFYWLCDISVNKFDDAAAELVMVRYRTLLKYLTSAWVKFKLTWTDRLTTSLPEHKRSIDYRILEPVQDKNLNVEQIKMLPKIVAQKSIKVKIYKHKSIATLDLICLLFRTLGPCFKGT